MGFLNNFGVPEIIILAILVLVFFGGKKITEFSKGLGESAKELKKAGKELRNKDSE